MPTLFLFSTFSFFLWLHSLLKVIMIWLWIKASLNVCWIQSSVIEGRIGSFFLKQKQLDLALPLAIPCSKTFSSHPTHTAHPAPSSAADIWGKVKKGERKSSRNVLLLGTSPSSKSLFLPKWLQAHRLPRLQFLWLHFTQIFLCFPKKPMWQISDQVPNQTLIIRKA